MKLFVHDVTSRDDVTLGSNNQVTAPVGRHSPAANSPRQRLLRHKPQTNPNTKEYTLQLPTK